MASEEQDHHGAFQHDKSDNGSSSPKQKRARMDPDFAGASLDKSNTDELPNDELRERDVEVVDLELEPDDYTEGKPFMQLNAITTDELRERDVEVVDLELEPDDYTEGKPFMQLNAITDELRERELEPDDYTGGKPFMQLNAITDELRERDVEPDDDIKGYPFMQLNAITTDELRERGGEPDDDIKGKPFMQLNAITDANETNPPVEPQLLPSVKYEYLDHTADVQIHAWGDNLAEAFEQCAMGMFAYITDIERVDNFGSERIEASGHDMLSLLFGFLDEWLFVFNADPYFVARKISITSFDRENFKISAVGYGETFNLAKHTQGTEVKAITYSNMQFHEKDDYAEVFVIIDI